jgi:diguanylate cyclase (GGDEF)-like protein
MASGWSFGPWKGIIGGMASAAITYLLFSLMGINASSSQFLDRGLIETCFLIGLGGFLGVESNLRIKLRDELLSHEQANRELEQIQQSEKDQRTLAEALIEVAANLTSELDLDEVLNKILASANRVVPHDGASIILLNSEMVIERVARATTSPGHLYNYVPGFDPFTNAPVQAVANLAQMARSGRPLVIPDTENYPAWVVFPESAWIRSCVGAPIAIQGRTVGFVILDSATPGFFQQTHAEHLNAFADLAAIAIHNARLYERSQQQALTDELTGLNNRRGLMNAGQFEVERALRFGHPFSVLMFDVDNFKQINDQSGYRAGDEVLYLLAKCCGQYLRSVDLVGRYGGDEFVVVLPEASLEGASEAAERIRLAIESEAFITTVGVLNVSISVGVAMLTTLQTSFEQVLEQAGVALHAAKFAGKNRVSE